jgi:uroporphyrinogen-III synthase
VIPLLILRPERGALATAKRAEAMGLSPMIRSLFKVVPRAWDAPDPALFDSILLTSANAVRYGGGAVALYRDLPVFAVGAATAQAARETGFTTVTEGEGNAADTIRALGKAGYSRPLHLAGEDRTPYPHVPFTVTARVVYVADPIDVELPTGRYAALVHSVRAATRFAEMCPSHPLVDVVAISASVADAVGTGWRTLVTADAPTDQAMLALAAPLCKSKTVPSGKH